MGNEPNNNPPAGVNPNSPMITGGLTTQVPDSVAAVPNTVTPNPNPTSVPPVPNAPSSLGQPGPAGPQAMPPAANAPTPTPTPAPQTKGEWFNHILKAVTPQQNVIRTNPDGTQSVTDQRTAPSMAKMFMASVMAGMMSPTKYRQGAYGPVVDSSGTAAGAFQAGADKGQEMSQSAQKQFDDMQTRKLNAVAANTQAMHQYAAMTQAQNAAAKEGAEAEALQTKNWNDITDQNKATILASADDYDNNRPKDSPAARLTSSMTTEELLASPFKDKMTSQLMIQDGTRSVYDQATGKQKTVPTWSVLNPDVDIKLNQAAVDRAAKINPQFSNLWQNTNGNVRMNLGRYTAVMHQVNSVDHAEDLLQGIADSDDKDLKALGIHGDVEGRLAAAARGNSTAMKALLDFESATAHGGDTADQLNRLLSSDGGDAIFKALGTDRDKVAQYVRAAYADRAEQTSEAAAGGKIAAAKAAREAKAAADNQLIEETANNLVKDPNSMASLQQIAGLRSDLRTKVWNRAQEISGGSADVFAAPKARAATYSSFNSADGKDRLQVQSYDTFLKHAADLYDATNGFIRENGTPKWIDKPLNWLEKNVASDPQIGAYLAKIEPVKDEFLNFLKANKAPLQQDVESMENVVDPNQSPRYMMGVIKSLADTGLYRLDSLNSTYKRQFNQNYDGLFDDESKDALQRLGMTDKIAKYGTQGTPLSQQTRQPAQSPEQIKQTKLQAITMPDGSHPIDIAYGANGAQMVRTAKDPNNWVSLTSNPAR